MGHRMEERLKSLIESVPELMDTAMVCRDLGLPNFYIAGGAITQIIWNSLLGRQFLDNVKDFDIVYFDSEEKLSEQEYEDAARIKLNHDVKIDIKNQANVHRWYPQKFGTVIPPYTRVEQGIDSWLSAFSIGFTLDKSDQVSIYSTKGLSDAFNMLVKPNKVAMTEASYLKMTKSFKKRWSTITVEPWA